MFDEPLKGHLEVRKGKTIRNETGVHVGQCPDCLGACVHGMEFSSKNDEKPLGFEQTSNMFSFIC